MGTYTGQDKRLQYLFQNGGGGGGGTNVEANPQGTPTDFLNTIKIGSLIYDVGKIGDIFSTQERQVGVWTDGKPLYQKTIDCGYAPNNTTKQVAHGINNVDKVVNAVGTGWSETNFTFYPVPFVQRSNAINQIQMTVDRDSIDIATGSNIFTAVAILVTLQYTKTTDTAGSGIYVPNGAYAMHYSTDEQVIGTYLGEILYQKTVIFGALPNATTKEVLHNISNLDYVTSCEITAKNPTTGIQITIPTANTAYLNQQIQAWTSDTKVHIRTAVDYSAYSKANATLRYTKTA